jgi:hypothetical protein
MVQDEMSAAVLSFPRRREGAGKSDNSWIKHGFVARVVSSQVAAYRYLHPSHRILLIDANAGDGLGVRKAQGDLFDGELLSRPTPQLLTELGATIGNADVCLCEKDKRKRAQLYAQFGRLPGVTIVADHAEVWRVIRSDHNYALWLSDPCGPKGHGVQDMLTVNRRVPTDFVVIFNETATDRIAHTNKPNVAWQTSRRLYVPMLDPQWWIDSFRKRYLARSRLIQQSPNFGYRVMVISNYLADAARREPFTEKIERSNNK